MALAPTKIVQALIQGAITFISQIDTANITGQQLMTKYQAKNPNLAGTMLTLAQVNSAKNLISGLSTLIVDNSAIITILNGKNVPSHGTGALG